MKSGDCSAVYYHLPETVSAFFRLSRGLFTLIIRYKYLLLPSRLPILHMLSKCQKFRSLFILLRFHHERLWRDIVEVLPKWPLYIFINNLSPRAEKWSSSQMLSKIAQSRLPLQQNGAVEYGKVSSLDLLTPP